MTSNDQLADLLEEFADLLEANGVEYKPRAYRRAAENVRAHPESVADVAATEGKEGPKEIEGIGDAIAAKLVEFVETGHVEELDELRAELPVDIEALTNVEGVGPKTVGTLYEELGVETLDDLEDAAEAGEIQSVKGFGPKTEQNILDSVAFARQASERELLGDARPRGEAISDVLADHAAVRECALAGSLRRWKATIGDVDVLVASDDAETVVDAFTDWEGADVVVEAGTTKASVRSRGVRIDLRVVEPQAFGAALQYFTGSKDHNVALRNRAIDRGLKMNEYGVFETDGDGGSSASPDDDTSETGTDAASGTGTQDDPTGAGTDESASGDPTGTGTDESASDDDPTDGERIAGETEASMYEALDLPWIPPELREHAGEIEAAEAGDLPDLVEPADLRGDLHTHTEWSDGDESVANLAAAADAFGHDYLAITDHATGPGMVGGVGVTDDELLELCEAVRDADDGAAVDLFAGVEANVAADGTVSVADDVLERLDLVVASPHASLDGDGTDRLVAAAKHPEVDVVGHPTGRYLNRREGLDVDVTELATVAADHGTALEVNANPRRLDLGGEAVRAALDAGATVVVNTDAHRPAHFEFLRYGVHTARRGWAEADDVLNARDADGVRDFLDA